MTPEEVVGHASTMLITDPAFPPGLYRFVREYLIVTYRTDYDALRTVVPKPFSDRGTDRQVRVHPHARLQRVWRYTKSG